ncbi:MAG: S-layer homology domain-containing protein [Clostridiales Family XIII bacterium]|jgi:uncharacterized repeat protein (TIGR02543 family)|nr:S-layer homology domain-containing protein [Clostridiales Family XIII bacterium]
MPTKLFRARTGRALAFALAIVMLAAPTPFPALADSAAPCVSFYSARDMSMASGQHMLVPDAYCRFEADSDGNVANPGAPPAPEDASGSAIGVFAGWYTAPQGDPNALPFAFAGVEKDMDVFAHFRTDALVSFLDGNGSVFLTKNVRKGDKVPAPTADEMLSFSAAPGHVFQEWQADGGQPYDFSLPVSQDITLKPLTLENSLHYVFFYSDGTQAPFQSVASGSYAARPSTDPSRTGYIFKGWSLSEDGALFDFESAPISSRTVLHAQWYGQPVGYTVMLWNEKENVAVPGEDTGNYEYYGQYRPTGKAPAGTHVTASAIAEGIDAAIAEAKAAAAKPPAAGRPPDRFNYLDTGERFISPSDGVLAGDGSTVVNVYLKRKAYTIEFDLAHSGGTMQIGGNTYTSGATKYSFTAKLGQDMSALWPTRPLAEFAGTGTYRFQGWYAKGDDVVYSSKQLSLGSAIASTADPATGVITMRGGWITGGKDIDVHYMFEKLPGQIGTAVRLGSKYYIEDPAYGQTVLSPATSAYNAKSIEGFTYVSRTAYRNDSGVFSLITGSPPKDQYLFYNRNSSGLIFMGAGAGADYEVSRRPGLNYDSIMCGTGLSGYEPASAPAKPPEGDKEYAFDGWYRDAAFLQPFSFAGASMPAYDLPLFAKWKVSQYRVSVYGYPGADVPLAVYGRAKDERVGNPSDELDSQHSYKAGHNYGGLVFNGWLVALGPDTYAPLSPDIPVNGNMSVYAEWTPPQTTYTVSYVSGGGLSSPFPWTAPADGNKYLPGTDALAKSPVSHAGLGDSVFVGWSLAESGPARYYPGQKIENINSDLRLYPVFMPAATGKPYTLTYNANFDMYASIPSYPPEPGPSSEDHVANDVVSVKTYSQAFNGAPVPKGHVFSGWSVHTPPTAPTATEPAAYAPGEAGRDRYKITTDAAMYAQYETVKAVYLSDLYSNDAYTTLAGVNIGEGYTVLGYDAVSAAAIWDSTGYTFAGWYDPSEPLRSLEQLYVPGSAGKDSLKVKGMTTYFVALYLKDSAQLVYHANPPGGPDATSAENVTAAAVAVKGYGDITSAGWPSSPPTTAGGVAYRFIGWNTKGDGSGAWHQPGGAIHMIQDPTSLYAQWQETPRWIVTFIPTRYAADPTERQYVVDEGSSVDDLGGPGPSDPQPVSGAAFIGWQLSGDDERMYSTSDAAAVTADRNLTFTAQWALLPPPATLIDNVPIVSPASFEWVYDGTERHNPLTVRYEDGELIWDCEAETTLPALLYVAGRFIIPLHSYSVDVANAEFGLESKADVSAGGEFMFAYVISDAFGPQIVTMPGISLKVRPRPLVPTAAFPDIYAGEPGPAFDGGYYSGISSGAGFEFELPSGGSGIVTRDAITFQKAHVELYTPYRPGVSGPGSYGIYARAGYYDSSGAWLGSLDDGFVNGGNYEIRGNPDYESDADYRIYRQDDGNFSLTSYGELNLYATGQTYEKIGKFSVLSTGQPQQPQSGGGGGGDVEKEEKPSVFVEDHIRYIYGYPDGLVKPERELTRAEASAVFFRLLSEGYREGAASRAGDFPDVGPGDWFYEEVSALSGLGIVTGYPDGAFRPDALISRAELAAIASRFSAIMKEGEGGASPEFSDVAGHWAEPAIRSAARIGWAEGYPDGSFRPESRVTRAEFVAVVNRMLKRAPETADDLLPGAMKEWPDSLPGKWYYLDIQEASNSHEYESKGKRVPNRDYDYERWTRIVEE